MTEETTNELALKVTHLTVNYERTPALWDISLEVPQGKFVGIIGPNGAGKSTLIKSVLGLIKPLSGQVFFLGAPLKEKRKKIAYIPQRESVDWDFPITVFDLVLMGRYGHLGCFRFVSKKDKELTWHYLEEVGMAHLAKRQISQLSGGQQQRAFIARSLCQEADLYFMDEPFAGLDITTMQTLIDLLQKLKKRGKTLFVVHHDLQSVDSIYDWVILLNMSLVANGEIKKSFTPEALLRAYGKDHRVLDKVIKLTQEKTEGYGSC